MCQDQWAQKRGLKPGNPAPAKHLKPQTTGQQTSVSSLSLFLGMPHHVNRGNCATHHQRTVRTTPPLWTSYTQPQPTPGLTQHLVSCRWIKGLAKGLGGPDKPRGATQYRDAAHSLGPDGSVQSASSPSPAWQAHSCRKGGSHTEPRVKQLFLPAEPSARQ